MAHEVERARLGRVALEQAGPLEVGEMGVDGRRRGKSHCLADLAHRRRIAVVVHVLDQESPDLLLTGGQHDRLLAVGRQVSNKCSQ